MSRKNINLSYLESIAKELDSKFRRINSITTKGRVAIGSYHEEILKTTIRNFLSRRYSVKTGYIYFDEDNVSDQIDIMIIDENFSFTYLFQEGDFAIVKPEAVVCVIEVKTKLDSNSFSDAFQNIYNAGKIKQKTLSGRLGGFIFAYDCSEPTNDWLEKRFNDEILVENANIDAFWPNLILMFNKANLLLLDTKGDLDQKKRRSYGRIFKTNDNDMTIEEKRAHRLSVFLSWILGSLGGNEVFASGRLVENFFSQIVDHSNQSLGIDGFRVGEERFLRST